ncbi:germin-like protein [Chenopodium quinoa]|uniref:germin-like protein n=1 Tax=Chenopodium quinoa TaxID=63459 RepID=UPI000B78E962|nr:germin-like protein [Chenopodium quinoa]
MENANFAEYLAILVAEAWANRINIRERVKSVQCLPRETVLQPHLMAHQAGLVPEGSEVHWNLAANPIIDCNSTSMSRLDTSMYVKQIIHIYWVPIVTKRFVNEPSFTHASTIEVDFCIANRSLPRSPQGYPCKDPTKVTTDDFVFTGFRGEKSTENIFGNNITLAFVDEFPAINGLGLSMARLDLAVGGVVPVHSHRTSEIIVVINGTIIAGIIDTNNTAYYKRLEAGDVMIFPQFLLHFQINVGKTRALAFVALNGANPGIQTTSTSLFGGNLPAEIASKITLISPEEVIRLKKIFGGISPASYIA